MSDFNAQQAYADHEWPVEQMVAGRRKHRKDQPDCAAAPMCIGPVELISLGVTQAVDPNFPVNALLVAIGKLDDTREMLAAEQMRSAAAEAEVRDLKLRCAGLRDELDAWESSADIIGPVGQPSPEGM